MVDVRLVKMLRLTRGCAVYNVYVYMDMCLGKVSVCVG